VVTRREQALEHVRTGTCLVTIAILEPLEMYRLSHVVRTVIDETVFSCYGALNDNSDAPA
jgi:hypothetical protein